MKAIHPPKPGCTILNHSCLVFPIPGCKVGWNARNIYLPCGRRSRIMEIRNVFVSEKALTGESRDCYC